MQEPGANASEIYATLKYIRPGGGFVPNFDMFAKTDVNGKTENPIYTFLKVDF
jgi:glutathione peroxidase